MIINKTVEELENDYWGKPPVGSSRLVSRCFELRKVKIKDLEIGDLRVLFSQNIALRFLMPIALDVLKNEPFIESEIYEGDLFQAILKVEKRFWRSNRVLWEDVKVVFEENKEVLEELDVSEKIKSDLVESFEKFLDI